MSVRCRIFFCSIILLSLSACNTIGSCDDDGNWTFGVRSEKKLDSGVRKYEEGNYVASVTSLEDVLETGLSSKKNKVQAYKYLAFIQCVSDREASCREYFKHALQLDPDFNLTPAESGHPIWGPIFLSVRANMSTQPLLNR
jgi:Tfp pilus assembly protein PilF